ncbi:MAG: hypothetical protein JW818_05170 [Pirellulales bacterium]|nr:hypothetical protein [Pirellulales bacterium]
MDDEVLFNELRGHVRACDYESCRELLLRYKSEGGTARRAYLVLDRLLPFVDGIEEQEDLVRDILDEVCGYCSPHVAIWFMTPGRPAWKEDEHEGD